MQIHQVTIKDLQEYKAGKRFSDSSPAHIAGRCLLDGLEFLRIDPKWPTRFGQLVNAHAIRLCWPCLKTLRSDDVRDRIRDIVELTYENLLKGRHDDIPYYGDDFWDWAYILEAMVTVFKDFRNHDRENALREDLRAFYEAVQDHLEGGLTLHEPREWFGPAMASAAYRALNGANRYLKKDAHFQKTLDDLKAQAITEIKGDKYLGNQVQPEYYHWHLGQVVAAFPKDTATQQSELRKLEKIKSIPETHERAYALARVLQGAVAIDDDVLCQQAIDLLIKCQNFSRPFGTGIIGDEVKGSLNTLEAIWPSLNADDRKEVKVMLNALRDAQKRSSRIGILVALDRERDACVKQFKLDGAVASLQGDIVAVNHSKYEVVILAGKALIEAVEATLNLIKEKRVTSIVMVGIAGSLGFKEGRRKFKGPQKGDVVIATATAGYRVREKVRETVTDAPVPYDKTTWHVLPADVTLFAHAHRASVSLKPKFIVYEGLIVTGNGIKDHPEEKKKVREKWAGGLAVAEEGFAAALACLHYAIPYLEIRGISDLAEGDKAKQKSSPLQEKRDQEKAADNAAKIVLALIRSLSTSW